MKKLFFALIVVLVLGLGIYGFLGFRIYRDFLGLRESTDLYIALDKENFERILKKAGDLDLRIKPYLWILKFDERRHNQYLAFKKSIQARDVIEELLGLGQEKTYLMVMQNNTELRPSGGFWGAYGILKIKNGKILSLVTDNSYYLDSANKGKFTAPAEVSSYFEDEWRFYNANWDPDFQKSVEQGLFFFRQIDPNIRFDGVIGPNVDFFLTLLKISGSINVPEHTFEIDEHNFVKKLIYEPVDPAVYQDRKDDPNFVTSPEEKKPLLGQIAKLVVDQFTARNKLIDFAKVSYTALENRDLLLYFPNADLEEQTRKLGWAGAMPIEGNFMMVVDANLGSKLDFLIDKSVEIKSLGGNQYRLVLSYTNMLDPGGSRQNQAFLVYRNLVRIFLPTGSELIESEGGQSLVKMNIDSKTSSQYLNSLIIIEPGQTERIILTWQVPEKFPEELTLYKQPGSHIKLNYDKD